MKTSTVCRWTTIIMVVSAVQAHPTKYNKTAAAKLFNAPDYYFFIKSSDNRMAQINKQRAMVASWLVEMNQDEPGEGAGTLSESKASYGPLDLLTTEVSQARSFLERLTNSCPVELGGFLRVNPDEQPAVAIWATAMQSYQDGVSRIVIPKDVRLLTFLTWIVQGVSTPSRKDATTYQWVDGKMIDLVTKQFLDAARAWDGDLLSLRHPEDNFNRQGHQFFWETLISYLGILSHYDRDYTESYLSGLLMCEYPRLSRWLWDLEYWKAIQEAFPGCPGWPWAAPDSVLVPFVKEYMPEILPELLKKTGQRLFDVSDQLFAYVPKNGLGQRVVQAQNMCFERICDANALHEIADAQVDGVASYQSTREDNMRAIQSDEEFASILKLWNYYLTQHIRIIEASRELDGGEQVQQLYWLRRLRKYLPEEDNRLQNEPVVPAGMKAAP